jgi:N-acetylglucosaminyl-diphospho-decaprenol L-rhamnosyltransferase
METEMSAVFLGRLAPVAVLIVGFRNATDIRSCLHALAPASTDPAFDVLICENGGASAYRELIDELVSDSGFAQANDEINRSERPTDTRFRDVTSLRFANRPSGIWIGCAPDNLGYAGGINAWLEPLLDVSGWQGIWILNPDTEPYPTALAELVGRAVLGGKAMVGSTILEAGRDDLVRFRGGLRWQPLAARSIAIGLGDPLGESHDVSAIEGAMDCPSGASMYVTRSCIEKIGLMDESYFLFFEDLDWGLRAKSAGLGYASGSVVAHKRGTTTGSALAPASLSRLSVYLHHRNAIFIVRKYFPWTLPIRLCVSLLHALRFLLRRAPNNFVAVLEGLIAGLRGETGRPPWHRNSTAPDAQNSVSAG